MPHLDDRVLAAWRLTACLHRPGAPGSPDDVEVSGRHLPPALRELHLLHDGGHWLSGNLALLPLRGDELSVTRASTTYRGWGWPVPEEVVVFGNDGGGDPLGLWLADTGARPVVVQIGQVFEPGCMAVVGQDLNAFLLAWTAYHLLGDDATTAGLDALHLPRHLRSTDPDDDPFAQILAWASPAVTGLVGSPYEARLTGHDVRRIASLG